MENPHEFPAQSLDDWKQAATKELRGKSLESISWEFEEMSISPFQNERPADEFFTVRKIGDNNDWQSRQDFRDARAIELALDALSNGTQLIGLPSHKLDSNSRNEFFKKLVDHGAKLVLLDEANSELIADILLAEKELESEILFEIEGVSNHLEIRDLLGATRYVPACVIDTYFGIGDSGSETIFEMALALASGNHSLARLTSQGMSTDQASAAISFKMSVGGKYLIEVCKWRVFRKLWARIVKEYQPESSCSINTRITANLGVWNKTVIDVDGNLIRQAAEAMAAAIGGADVILIPPYDHQEAVKSARLARNIHHLLKGESWLTHVKDPLKGSYFFERLSEQLADEVWKKFQDIDSRYEELMRNGETRNWLNDQRIQSISRLEKGEEIRVGGNKYQPKDIRFVADVTTSTSAWEKEGGE